MKLFRRIAWLNCATYLLPESERHRVKGRKLLKAYPSDWREEVGERWRRTGQSIMIDPHPATAGNPQRGGSSSAPSRPRKSRRRLCEDASAPTLWRETTLRWETADRFMQQWRWRATASKIKPAWNSRSSLLLEWAKPWLFSVSPCWPLLARCRSYVSCSSVAVRLLREHRNRKCPLVWSHVAKMFPLRCFLSCFFYNTCVIFISHWSRANKKGFW